MKRPRRLSTSPPDDYPETAAGKQKGKRIARVNHTIYVPLPDTAYEYTALPTKEPHVRLMMLGFGLSAPWPLPEVAEDDENRCNNISPARAEPLRAILFTTPLSEVGDQYIALSYTWGTENPTKGIHTPTGFLHITSNLDAALRRILDTFSPGVCVWADAVCIDQRNDTEKAGQIRLMPSIYACANHVAAYLGPEDMDSAAVVELISRLAKCDFDDERKRPRDFDDLERCGLPAFKDVMWVALQRFIGRSWFRRVWIVQECLVAKSVTLFWADEWSLPFETLRIPVIQLWKMGIPVLQVDCENTEAPAVAPDTVIKGWNCLLHLVRLKRSRELGEREDLLSILMACRNAEATLKRDKYFALVGLSKAADKLDENPDLRPDYKQPFVDVSINYTKYLLKSRAPEDATGILSLAQPRFPDPSLPSWVPDWNKQLEAEQLTSVYPHPVKDELYRTAVFSPPTLKTDKIGDGRTLVVRGAVFQPIAFIGNDYWTKYRQEHVQSTILLLMMDVRMFGQSIKSYPTGEPVVEVLWKTVTLNQYSGGASTTNSLLTGFPNAAVMASVSAARKLFESVTDFGNSSAVRGSVTVENFNAAGVAFVKFGDMLRGWKFAIFAGGYVGMVPITAQKSDLVVIIAGARAPYVVRRVPGTCNPFRYNLVGECYVHGIMQGELLNNGISLNWEEFRLT